MTNKNITILTSKELEMLKEGYFTVNNTIRIDGGEILNNPFFKELTLNRAGQWMVQNRAKVEKVLKSKLSQHSTSTITNETDCFFYGLEYFLNKENDFKPFYHGSNVDYAIEGYIMKTLGYMVKSYVNNVNDKKNRFSSLITQEEYDSNSFGVIADREVGLSVNLDIDKELNEKDLGRVSELYSFSLEIFDFFVEDLEYNFTKEEVREIFFTLFINKNLDTVDKKFNHLSSRGIHKEAVIKLMEEMRKYREKEFYRLDELSETIEKLIVSFKHIEFTEKIVNKLILLNETNKNMK